MLTWTPAESHPAAASAPASATATTIGTAATTRPMAEQDDSSSSAASAGPTPAMTPFDAAKSSPTATKTTDGQGAAAAGLSLDFDPKFDFLAQGREPTSLEWRDLTYTIKKKEILHGLSGQANPGDVVAIMVRGSRRPNSRRRELTRREQGPSGAGKSTLLNILAGRALSDAASGKRVDGEFRINGRATSPKSYRSRVAYVMQEDALFATATVRESLEFSARLRLPAHVTADERKAIVDDILESLGLTRVQHTMIGSASVRGVSGGERKRVAIGVELVSAPAVMFLDEPTSGLDSVSAWKVVRILNALANAAGRPSCTVLCSIHQPSSEVFAEFSHVILLGQGHAVFQGPVADLGAVLAASGFHIPLHSNPADFAMLCVQTQPLEKLPRDNANTRAPRAVYGVAKSGDLEEGSSSRAPRSWSARLPGSFALTTASAASAAPTPAAAPARRVGWGVQAFELAKREFKALWRDQAQFAARFGTTVIISILTGVLFMNVADQTLSNYAVQNQCVRGPLASRAARD